MSVSDRIVPDNSLSLGDDDPNPSAPFEATAGEDGSGFADEVVEEPQLPSFFIHRDEVVGIITNSIARLKAISAEEKEKAGASGGAVAPLPYPGAFTVPSIGTDPHHVQASFFKMEQLLAIYQEAPTLLLPHLEELMGPLLEAIMLMMPRSIDEKKGHAHDTCNTNNTNGGARDAKGSDAVLGRDYYEYDADSPKTALHNLCRALYFVIKVAGPKACTSHLPHDVRLLEDVFYCLRRWQTDPDLKREWEVRYCFLLWLSSLVLVPFSFSTIDSAIGGDAAAPLSQQLLESAWQFLSEPSRCREAAALLIARLNTRTDSQQHRSLFFARALEAIKKRDNDVLRNGVLLAIATTHKFGKREELVAYSPALIPVVGDICVTSKDVKTAKTAVKVLQRLGLSLLKQRTASWKYRQTVLSLEANLARAMAAQKEQGSGGGAQPSGSNAAAAAAAEGLGDGGDDDEDDMTVPDAIEDVIGYLLSSLSHTDTIVRWSAAKGIGRICARLPKDMARDIVAACIEVFDLYENDCGWHGGLLALAELCRGSILFPEDFGKAMPLVAKGLHYELSRGSFSVGAHVRDAACYVCWSVARAYNTADLEQYAKGLSTALITTALFDREVNVRRAAAAAFQECVGRLGNFPNGIDLVTTMDFFSLATARNAYLVAAPLVAAFEAYRPALMDHLFKTKLVHWDRAVRGLAAEALAAIGAIDPSAAEAYFMPLVRQATATAEVSVRHGSVLGAAAMLRTVGAIPQPSVDAAVNIIPTLDSARHFRGRGVEYVRQACCFLVRSLASSGRTLPEHVEVTKLTGQKGKAATRGNLQRFLEDSWKQPLEWLQRDAVDAFYAFSRAYYAPYVESFHGKMFATMVQGTADGRAPNERRGCAAAMGAIPLSMALAPLPAAPSPAPAASSAGEASAPTAEEAPVQQPRVTWEEAFDVLKGLTVVSANKDEQDAETRRNAVRALATLACTLGPHLTEAAFVDCCGVIYANSFTDYAVDKRGDVGSYARTEALRAVPLVLGAALNAGLLSPTASDAAKAALLSFVRCALKQAVEKIDRVRSIAGSELKALLTGPNGADYAAVLASIPAVPAQDLAALAAVVRTPLVDWAAPQETFPVIVGNLITTETFGPAVMEGMPASVGGLSLHVLRSAQDALFAAFEGPSLIGADGEDNDNDGAPPQPHSQQLQSQSHRLTKLLVEVAARNAHSERLVVPLCTTIERLIERGLFAEAYLPDVVDMLTVETRHFATDINRLLSFIPLLGALCQSTLAAVRKAAWHHALVLIASRYPKARARVATELYTAVLMTSARGGEGEKEEEGDLGGAMELLTTTQWDDTDVAAVTAARGQLYGLLGLKPEEAADYSADGALTMSADDALRSNRRVRLGTYTSLVHEMGY